MATMDDLDKAIRDVLSNAIEYQYGTTPDYIIDANLLRLLQAEYNIHFVEPDEAQLAEIE